MRKQYLINLMAGMMLVGMCGMAKAITWGEPADDYYPNVVSLRGIIGTKTKIRCTGSLLHIDSEKIVILTAAHCTDRWLTETESVQVSFDSNSGLDSNGLPQPLTDANYVSGGVPISMPEKDSPFEKFDYGLVVFSSTAKDLNGNTIDERWGSGNPAVLTPVQLPPMGYLQDLIKSVNIPTKNLSFTAVGYGTGERFSIPGEEEKTKPAADPTDINFGPFLIRHIADNLSYKAHNPVNDVLRLSGNIAKGENGTCSGDSGGPIFYEDGSLGRVQVSLVSGGDAPCRATSTGPGFSRQEAFDFVNCGIEKKVVGERREDREVGDVVECVGELGL
jgi:hypothetical protein